MNSTPTKRNLHWLYIRIPINDQDCIFNRFTENERPLSNYTDERVSITTYVWVRFGERGVTVCLVRADAGSFGFGCARGLKRMGRP